MELPKIPKKLIRSVTKILTDIKKPDGTDLLTKSEAETLANLQFSQSGRPVLTTEDFEFMYEIIWMIVQPEIGYQNVYNFLSTDWEIIFGTTPNIRKKILFENPLLSGAREKFLVDMEIYRNKIDVEEAGEECPKCQSSSTVSATKQKRSADEMAAITIFCTDCKYKWYAQ